MNRVSRGARALLVLTCAVAMFASLGAVAQSYEQSRAVIAAGGGGSSGGVFVLTGTIGQAEAGPPASGGAFQLEGGFWAGSGVARGDDLFRDSFEN